MSEWDSILQFALLGLGTGAIYAVGALGIVAIHRGTKTLNFAQGGVAVWGAYLFGDLRDKYGIPAIWSAVLAVLAGAAIGGVTYLLVIRPIRHTTPLTRMVATLGVLAILLGLRAEVFPDRSLILRTSLPLDTIDVFGQPVGQNRMILLAIAVLITAGLATWSAFARIPLATRAMAEHERAAQAIGASPHVLGTLNWALGCGLAALAGLLVAPIIGRNETALSVLVIFSLSAALLGRFDSYWLSLVGGLVLGVGQSLITHFAGNIFDSGYEQGWDKTVPFLVVMLVVLLRREEASNRLAAVRAIPVAGARIRAVPALGALVAAIAFIGLSSTAWVDAAIVSICFAILALSLVVLIGYANQISLAQMAIAGLGAFVAVRLAISFGVPFIVCPLIGAVSGAAAGLLVGIPALRIRGINLAVVTAGLGFALSEVLFQNSNYTGGFEGLVPPVPSILGTPVDAARHPQRYAFVALVWLVIAVVITVLVRRSRFGRQLLVMRTNERGAAASGVSTGRAKLAAFVVSSALAGMAGVLLAFRATNVSFLQFTFQGSINLVIVAVIAGVAASSGGLLAGLLATGGVVLFGLEQLHVSILTEHYTTIFGIGLVLTLIFRPNGAVWRAHMQRDPTGVRDGTVPNRASTTLSVRDVEVQFGGIRAVDGAGIEVEPSTVVGLVGPNGAGKSSLLDAVSGFARVRSGSIMLGKTNLLDVPAWGRARVGVGRVFQGVELFEDLTVAQNIRIAAENAGDSDGRLPAVATDAVERLGLGGDLDRRPTELSLAKRKFAGIIRALAANPSVLLLDEPGAGLSMVDMQRLAAELRHLAHDAGLAVLVVDHDMGLVLAACDRIVVLQDGRVLAEGTPSEITANAAVRSAYLGDSVELLAAEHVTDRSNGSKSDKRTSPASTGTP